MTTSDAVKFLAARNSPDDLWQMLQYTLAFRRHPAIRGHWRNMARNYMAAIKLQNECGEAVR